MHSNLVPGTLQSILRQAGVSLDDFAGAGQIQPRRPGPGSNAGAALARMDLRASNNRDLSTAWRRGSAFLGDMGQFARSWISIKLKTRCARRHQLVCF
jgi:hypothetical protein